MSEKEKSPYDKLLEELANVKEENANLRKDFEELREFNRALLARSGNTNPVQKDDVKERFDAYLKGE